MQPLEENQTQALSQNSSDEGSILKEKTWQPSQEVIQNNLDVKHAEPVPASEPFPTQHHHLPLHAVFKENSTSNKIRVFDGSATTTSESSLNQFLDWDEEMPSKLMDLHFKWRSELPLVSQTRLLRYYSLSDHSMQELHGFSDASKKAFGAVVYSRTIYLDHTPEFNPINIISTTSSITLQIYNISSNHHITLAIATWCLRFCNRIRHGRPENDTRSKHLSEASVQLELFQILREFQTRSFLNERKALEKGQVIQKASRLLALSPFLDKENILRVGGRLANSALTQSQKNPIIGDGKDSLIIKFSDTCIWFSVTVGHHFYYLPQDPSCMSFMQETSAETSVLQATPVENILLNFNSSL